MKENKAASHTSYTQAKGDRICELLLEGESLESVLKRKGMPSYRLFMYWLAGERIAPEEASALVQKYARARELADDRAFDSMVQRVKDTPKDRESVQLMRLQIDTEKWTLARKRPKKYGERLDVTVDASSLQPPQVIVQIVNAQQPKQLEDVEDAEIIVTNGEKPPPDDGKHDKTPRLTD